MRLGQVCRLFWIVALIAVTLVWGRGTHADDNTRDNTGDRADMSLIAARDTAGQIAAAYPLDGPVAGQGRHTAFRLPGTPPGKGETLDVYFGLGDSVETLRRVTVLTWSDDGSGGGRVSLVVPSPEIDIAQGEVMADIDLFFVHRDAPNPTSGQTTGTASGASSGASSGVATVFRGDLGVTSPLQGRVFAFGSVALLYAMVAIGLYARRRGTPNHTETAGAEAVSLIASFSPLQIIRSREGTASLSSFQILAFTLIIGGLLAYALWLTHSLSDLSDDLMVLLGIAGGGGLVAKGVADNVGKISARNWAFLVRNQWLTQDAAPVKAARLSDLVMRDGRVDLFRLQNLLFTVLVGVSLFMQEVGGLAEYEIPPAIFGLLGLSQIAYVGGKAVGNDMITALDTALTTLQAKQQALLKAAGGSVLSGTAASQLERMSTAYPAQWQDFRAAEQTAEELTRATFPASRPRDLGPEAFGLVDRPDTPDTPAVPPPTPQSAAT
ncbi:MAG: hypothetical protein NXI16_16145 [Alphaproteobacteria bacterium]|nr:hypothetical protein [Alphaproteobacteria bacterium]